jgi:hypothetical protein
MAYFNEFAGGPLGGHYHLLDANIDWGQELLGVKRWTNRHPEARPFHLHYFGMFDPNAVGLDFPQVPRMTSGLGLAAVKEAGYRQLTPGWYALSVNDLHGYRHSGGEDNEYVYLQKFRPIATIGYAIYIYHLTDEDVAAVRQDIDSSLAGE